MHLVHPVRAEESAVSGWLLGSARTRALLVERACGAGGSPLSPWYSAVAVVIMAALLLPRSARFSTAGLKLTRLRSRARVYAVALCPSRLVL